MKEIALTQGKVALVDDEDYERILLAGPWTFDGRYARGTAYKGGQPYKVRMHQLIAGVSGEVEIDHIDGDKLNNRKCNLRACTRGENQRNRGPTKASATGIKGVSIEGRKFLCQIQVEGIKTRLGTFDCPLEAARAYDEAALSNFGEFAWLNNLTEITPEHFQRIEQAKARSSSG